MELKSDHSATSITNYQAIFTPCYHNDMFRIVIRSYDREGLGYFLLVDPDNFATSIVLKGDIQHRKQNVGQMKLATIRSRLSKRRLTG